MTEQQPYDVLRKHDDFEVRRYPTHFVAQVDVDGTFDSAGSTAFSLLFGYITGDNQSSSSMQMTAPVVRQPAPSESIAMTAPVTQTQTDEGSFVVAFVLPEAMTLDSAPIPSNPKVRVREVPERLAAALVYSGRDSAKAYDKHLHDLLGHLKAAGLEPDGPPMSARFDAPNKPGFLRRNEVVQPVVRPDGTERGLGPLGLVPLPRK